MTRAYLLLEQGDAAEEAGDYALALQCFAESAALGDETGCLRLGLMFDCGIGTPVDKARAMACYRRGWRKRDTGCANNIAVLYREQGDHRRMFQWFRRAAGEGDGSAYLQIGKCYLAGLGVRRDLARAVSCLAEAVRSDDNYQADREEAQALLCELRPKAL